MEIVKKQGSILGEEDTDHNEHYYCRTHSTEIACSHCYLKDQHCTICGMRLQYKNASLQEKVFINPSTRGMLGF